MPALFGNGREERRQALNDRWADTRITGPHSSAGLTDDARDERTGILSQPFRIVPADAPACVTNGCLQGRTACPTPLKCIHEPTATHAAMTYDDNPAPGPGWLAMTKGELAAFFAEPLPWLLLGVVLLLTIAGAVHLIASIWPRIAALLTF